MWNSMPFLRLLITYLLWRFFGEWTFLVICAYFAIHAYFQEPKRRTLIGGLGLLFAISCFELIAFFRTEQATNMHSSEKIELTQSILLELERENENWQHWKSLNLNAPDSCFLLHIKKPSSLRTGDTLVFKAVWLNFEKAAYPGDFDQEKYRRSQSIFKHAFLSSYLHLPGNEAKSTLKTSLFRKLKAHLTPFPDELEGLFLAMLTGEKSDLDRATKLGFQSSGLMHILAVSGLHVGLVAALPLMLLKSIPKLWLKTIILTRIGASILVWTYAYFTGLSPSICRAAVMFSFFLWAPSLRGNHQKINVLCASAFILLLIEPSWLGNVGFQLSYSAVVGIFLLMPVFQSCWNSEYRLSTYLRDGLAVSMAAQVATLPLSLFYFNQFPTYFLLSNLIVAPLLVVIIYLLMGLIVLNELGLQFELLYELISFLSEWTLRINEFIISLPNALIQGLHPRLWISILGFAMIAVLIHSTKIHASNKRFTQVLLFSSLCLLFVLAMKVDYYLQHKSSLLIQKNGDKHFIIQNNKEGILISSEKSAFESSQIQRNWEKYYGIDLKMIAVETDTMLFMPFECALRNGTIYWERKSFNLSNNQD
ncbi:MAG: ComEC/Rec2 family competence protein [Flavobacteriales bacterium]|nr:ComEC/Rec2 family competence protein [Flavobacteriales bacterium]